MQAARRSAVCEQTQQPVLETAGSRRRAVRGFRRVRRRGRRRRRPRLLPRRRRVRERAPFEGRRSPHRGIARASPGSLGSFRRPAVERRLAVDALGRTWLPTDGETLPSANTTRNLDVARAVHGYPHLDSRLATRGEPPTVRSVGHGRRGPIGRRTHRGKNGERAERSRRRLRSGRGGSACP